LVNIMYKFLLIITSLNSALANIDNKVLVTPINGLNTSLIKQTSRLTINTGGSATVVIPSTIISEAHFPIGMVDNVNNHAYTLVGKNNQHSWVFNAMKLEYNTPASAYLWSPVFNTDVEVIIFYI